MTTSIYARTQNFLEKAKEIHGERYDYSTVKYINSKTIVEIICPIHGVYQRKPNDHISSRKCGCPTCSNREKLTTKSFIAKSKEIHGNNKYDYSVTTYTHPFIKLDIICPEHGKFSQTPNNHFAGSGCKKCGYGNRKSYGWVTHKNDDNADEICFLYTIKLTSNGEEFYKTGITKDLYNRHRKIEWESGYDIEVIDIIIDTRYVCNKIENKIIEKRQRRGKYKPLRLFGGWTECYSL